MTAASLSTGMTQDLAFTRYELPNGLTVILHEDHRLPLVAVNLWYFVGSKDEPQGRSGFAHLFEHLMFMGTNGVPYPEFDVEIEKGGGSNNATTSEDRTNYFESGPKEMLATFLRLEADRMATLGTSMTREKLDVQRDVVRNERRQSYENRPYGKAFLEIPRQLYPQGHPYHEPVIGSHEDLESATVGDVQDFFAKFYFPRNACLVVAGDFDPAEAKELIHREFAPLASRSAAARRPPPAPVRLDRELRVDLDDEVELPLLILTWHSPPAYEDGDADMDVLASILGGGKSSRLYRRLVYDRKIAQEVAVYQGSRLLGSEFQVFVYARPEASLDEIQAEIDAEIARVREQGPTAREVDRARNKIETSFWERIQSVSDRADMFNVYQFYFNDPGALRRDRARYEQVTPESVAKWARSVLLPASRLAIRVVPRGAKAAAP
jgi:zinc protease